MVWDVFLHPDGGVTPSASVCTIIITGETNHLSSEDWSLPMKMDTKRQLLPMTIPGSILVKDHIAMQDFSMVKLMMPVWKKTIIIFQNRISRQKV